MMSRRLFYSILIIFVIIPLLLGLILYVVFRQDAYISQFILRFIRISNLSKVKSHIAIHFPLFAYLSKNYLSDCCWAFSLESCLALILQNSEKKVISSLIISAVFLSSMETLQLTPLIPGTFDFFDIIIELTAIAFSGIIINLLGKRCVYEKIN